MAPRPSPNSLIHCAACGEDYSATYKRCPFCGAKNAPPVTPKPKPKPTPFRPPETDSRSVPDPDDTYVFQGQDVFDEEPGEDDYRPARPKGGKRLAEKPSSSPFASAEINWPRVITFLCGLVIIIAALVIVFTSVYPKLRGPKDPTATGTDSPSPGITDPVSQPTDPVEPNVTDPVEPGVTEPGTDVTEPPVAPNPDELLTVTFKGRNDADFTLGPAGSGTATHTITFNFDPPGWSGPITWSSSNTAYATVDANGKVTNVNTTSKLHKVLIRADVGGIVMESTVYCKGVPAAEPTQPPATQPPATQPPASQPPASDPPATQTPSGGGSVTVGRRGTIVNAELGLRVRSGPGTSYTVLATLRNGSTVNVLEAAEGGWYKITFPGAGGAATEGYILGEYISTN